MALTESDIKIIISGELKKAGFDKAKKATNQLEDNFKKLGRTIALTFSVAAVTKFAKESVKAFKEDEIAARRFEQALKGVNLGFATPEIEKYLESLERSTAVTKGELRPAFQTLAQTTQSVAMSQDILATALDVSAGSGVDLNTVVNDLSRAYLGNNTSLAKYNLGLSKAELRTTRFKDVQDLLNKQFAGQKAAQLDTYAGKVAFISTAFERMQTTVGEGLVDAFGMLAGENGIQGATTAMEEFGTISADVIRGLGYLVGQVTQQIGGQGGLLAGLQSTAMTGNPLAIALVALQKLGAKTRPLFFPTAGIGAPGVAKQLEEIEKAAIERQKELERLRLKSIKQQEKINRLKQISAKIDKAASKFDERRIQIAAALQGNISDEERRRLMELQTIEELKQAIQEQDVEKAEKLLERLNDLQSQTETLAETLVGLKAGDPFANWDDYFKKASDMIDDLYAQLLRFYDLANKFVYTEKIKDTTTRTTTDKTVDEISKDLKDITDKNDKIIKDKAIDEALKVVSGQTTITDDLIAATIDAAKKGMLTSVTASGIALAESGTIGATSLANRIAAFDSAAIAASALTQLLSPSAVAAMETGAIGAASISGQAQIIVNNYIEGSVVSAEDLADQITNAQYLQQQRGRGLLYSARAI